jgi:putative acetyltransferase
LTECRLSGYDLVLLLGAPRYYSRFGFQRASAFDLTNEHGEDEPFQVCELHPGALQEVSGLVKYTGEFFESGC